MKSVIVSLLFALGIYNVAAAEITPASLTNLVTQVIESTASAVVSTDERVYKTPLAQIRTFLRDSTNAAPALKPTLRWTTKKLIELTVALSEESANLLRTKEQRAKQLSSRQTGGTAYGVDLAEAQDMVIIQLERDAADLRVIRTEIKELGIRLTKLLERLKD